jgi:hypothetical protein
MRLHPSKAGFVHTDRDCLSVSHPVSDRGSARLSRGCSQQRLLWQHNGEVRLGQFLERHRRGNADKQLGTVAPSVAARNAWAPRCAKSVADLACIAIGDAMRPSALPTSSTPWVENQSGSGSPEPPTPRLR